MNENLTNLISGMTVIIDGKKFILPISIIKRSFKTDGENITTQPGGGRIIDINEGITSLLNLSDYLDLPPSDKPLSEQIVMLLQDKRRRVCVLIDELVGECKFECKPLPVFCGDGLHIGGCAIISEDEMSLFINHEDLFEGIEPDGPEEDFTTTETAEEQEEAIIIDKSGTENKYLTFELFGEHYALHIEYVKEIISLCGITLVPKAPAYVEGIINRRGDIVPIINFSKMLMAKEGEFTNIVIIEYNDISVGMLIEKIKETITIPEENVDPLPQNKESVNSKFVSRSGRYDGNVYLILELSDIYAAFL